MRLVGIEIPCLIPDTEQHLLFQEDERIDLGTEIAVLYFKLDTETDLTEEKKFPKQYMFEIDVIRSIGSREELEQSVIDYIHFEFADRLQPDDRVKILYHSKHDE